jgi:exodeoxyribonuclease VII small subunit
MEREQTNNNINLTSDINAMSFETALKELENITNLLEKGNVELDHAIRYYERACTLQEHCQKKMNDAQMKVEKLLHKNGQVHAIQPSILEETHNENKQ